jgi:hypothetical protein
MSSAPTPADNTPPVPEISSESVVAVYSNMVRGLMTAEEVVLDFGFNANTAGKVVEEPARITTRVILSYPSAVRLHQLLQALLLKRQELADKAKQEAETAPSGA